MSTVFAVANQKGGVGKTTTAISLAAGLARRGHDVLLVDTDPQANATAALGQGADASAGLYDALIEESPLDRAIVRTQVDRLWLATTTPDLAGAEVELVSVMAREYRMRRALAPIRERYDFALIDCPPSLGLLTVNALTAADQLIIPVQAEFLALEGLTHLLQTVDLVRRNLHPSLRVRGILLTMFDTRTNIARQVEAEVRSHFDNTFRTVIPRSVRLSEAPSHGEPIQLYDPLSAGARAYDRLTDELLEQTTQPLEAPAPAPGGSHGT